LIVTLPEATPVHEAAALQDDLRRAGIHPYAWIVNQSFAITGSMDPLLIRRGSSEARYLREVTGSLASRIAVLPWSKEEPVGAESLAALLRATSRTVGPRGPAPEPLPPFPPQ
jgi:arsenite-transporting ATPase